MMVVLRNLFIGGLLLLVPVLLTVWILGFLLGQLDDFSQPLLRLYIGGEIPYAGAILTVIIIMGFGAFSNFFVGQRIVAWFERQVSRVPVVRTVYSTTRQVVRGFSSAEGMNFKRTVLLRYPGERLVLGFVTAESRMSEGDAEPALIAVYVPTNHLYLGDVFLVAPDRVIDVPLTLEEGISAVLSCGGSLEEHPELVAAVLSGGARRTADPAPS